MRSSMLRFAAVLVSILCVQVARAQVPQPAPEMEHLKKMVGTWDATIEMEGQQSKGTSVWKMDLGGMWLASEFKGEFGGMEFQGKGFDTYDAAKKKFVSVWMDSMSSTPMTMEGTMDKDGKKYTMTGEGPGPDGNPAKYKSVSEFKDADTILFTMYMVADDKDNPMIKITYKRKK
jgi:hypothetical protein